MQQIQVDLPHTWISSPPGNWAESQEPNWGQDGGNSRTHTPNSVHTRARPDQHCAEINFHPLNKPHDSFSSIVRMTFRIYVAPEDTYFGRRASEPSFRGGQRGLSTGPNADPQKQSFQEEAVVNPTFVLSKPS